PIDIFCRIDSLQDQLCIDMRRQGQLDEDPIHGVVAVKPVDEFQHFSGRDACGWSVPPACQAELFARGDFALYVELRRGIFANQNWGEAGTNALGSQARYFLLYLDENVITNFGSVEDARGHDKIIAHGKCATADSEKQAARDLSLVVARMFC